MDTINEKETPESVKLSGVFVYLSLLILIISSTSQYSDITWSAASSGEEASHQTVQQSWSVDDV